MCCDPFDVRRWLEAELAVDMWSLGLMSRTLLEAFDDELSVCLVVGSIFELAVEILRWLLRSLIKSFGFVRICDCVGNGCDDWCSDDEW